MTLNSQHLNLFEYFLACYFNSSTNYDDLNKLGLEFIKSENDYRKEELLREVELLKSVKDWNLVQRFVREYGMRNVNTAQSKEILDILIECLSKDL